MSDIIVGDKQDLVAVADSIRGLVGGGQMYVSEMATNIDGAKTAVDAALTALSEKGVEVPDGTKVDGLAALIAAIESGGGGKIAVGSITFAEPANKRTKIADIDFIPSAIGFIQAELPTTLRIGEVGCSVKIASMSETVSFGLLQLSPSVRYYCVRSESNGIFYNKSGYLEYWPTTNVSTLSGTYYFFAVE